MIRTTPWRTVLAVGLVLSLVAGGSGCADAVDAITAHARPVAVVGPERLGVTELAEIMAESPLPDSALTEHWAFRIGRLWADYVSLIHLFQSPDTTAALDYDPLLENARFYATLAVRQYRDSVVLAGTDPTDEEVREYFDREQPLTRLDVRRIVLDIPDGAPAAVRDSILDEARRLRNRVAGGADFVEVARNVSDEPAAARGQILGYQAHEDFPAAADSVVFRLAPGEISPVFFAEDEVVFYRIERRRAPEFSRVADMVRRELTEERRARRLSAAADSLLENSRRVVLDGAVDLARRIVTSDELAEGRISSSMRLVRYEGGDFRVGELRGLLRARPDLKRRFAEADDEELALFLYQLAGDDVLIRAAEEHGIETPEEARREMREGIAGQLAAIAGRMRISHRLASSPAFSVGIESRQFVRDVLEKATAVPWAGEFRQVLDQHIPSRVDERGAEDAARRARALRGVGPTENEAPVEGSPRSLPETAGAPKAIEEDME